MPVRLKDIANKANVSISTVSRVINNDKTKPAKKETADRVWRIVNEMGYVPNQEARNLIRRESGSSPQTTQRTIGCVYISTSDCHHDPFFSHMAAGIKEELDRHGYIMGYSFSILGMDFSNIFNLLVSHPVNGIIVMGVFNQDILDYLKVNYPNIVYAGVNSVGAGFDEVICDAYKGATQAVEYLIEKGHKRIGFLGNALPANSEQSVNEHRFEAFVDTMKKNNLSIDNRYIVRTEQYTPLAYEAMKAYLADRDKTELPTALFCGNDASAIGAMKAMNEVGIRIPEDISLVGFDDIEMASFVQPDLTTINVPKEELGQMAVKMLIDRIENNRNYPVRMDIPFHLVERNSSSHPM